MNGTTLTQTELGTLASSVIACLPPMSSAVAGSWPKNHKALRALLTPMGEIAPAPEKKKGAKGQMGKTIRTLTRAGRFKTDWLGKDWSVVEDDAASLPDSFDLSKLAKDHVLRDGEGYVQGEEMLKRFKDKSAKLLCADHFQHFWDNQDDIPSDWNIIYFPGTILKNPRGYRYILSLLRMTSGWKRDCNLLGGSWYADNPSAALG